METEIREGFLCPICLADLGSLFDLQLHFEEVHSDEDHDVLDQIKGLFGKAKRKILGSGVRDQADLFPSGASSDLTPDDPDGLTATGYLPSVWEPQELGATRCCTSAFKHVREARLDRYVVETNKLVIRLDKLLSADAPSDPGKRKAFEKSVVPWAPDACVNLCTTCGKSFSLVTRRRHHCRLCGGVMCHRCSQFLPHSYARKMMNPAFSYEGEGFLRRSSSNSSLSSVLSPEGEPHLRTCVECRTLLERRDQQIQQRHARPLIVQLYEKMRTHLNAGDVLLPRFLQMADSLSVGESMFNLTEASQLRSKILKAYESANAISKRIVKLGQGDLDTVSMKTAQLQRNIGASVSSALQQKLLGLQTLPSLQELDALQESKAQKQIGLEEERRRLSSEARGKGSSSVREGEGEGKGGWKPSEVDTRVTDHNDPMVQQMNIIRAYVKQAREARKWDEVRMLEENLKQLQLEFWSQSSNAEGQ